MREIKFRGKDSIENWRYGTLIAKSYDNDGKIDHFYEIHGINNNNFCSGIVPETVGQFTGLKDKNGNEIYEGDIIRTESDRICQIKHNQVTEYCVNKRDGVTDMFQYFGFGLCFDGRMYHFDLPETMAVIGNIHDSPELINATPEAVRGE